MSVYDSPLYRALTPFFNEPDYFKSCAYGLPFIMKRNHAKAWCGYVGVPVGHPHYGLSYSDRVSVIDRTAIQLKQQSPISILIEAAQEDDQKVSIDILYDCPGGITWAKDHAAGEYKDGYWYFGFDCHHYNDLGPRDIILASQGAGYPSEGREYRTFEFVRRACFSLADQLTDFAKETK